MRILVCGSRTFLHRDVVWTTLDGIALGLGDDPEMVVIEGQCPYGGADAHAEAWALSGFHSQVSHQPFPPEYDANGKILGPERNRRMLTHGRPDVVWAFVDKPLAESRGTAHMVRIARDAGVPVRVVEVAS